MFKKGYVIHYVNEYSSSSGLTTRNKILNYTKNSASKNISLVPKLSEQSFITLTENLPVGSIVCIDMSNEAQSSVASILICFPLFSSHVSLPVKPGEIVWYYKDEENNFDKDVYEESPLLSVNAYWISRKIGAKISEDLNYSFAARDSLISNTPNNVEEIADQLYQGNDAETKKQKKEFIKKETETISLPDFKMRDIFNESFGYLPDSVSIYNQTKAENSFYPNATPRWFSKPYELTLQGSNNSIVNLTKTNSISQETISKGAVDIVAGRHSLFDYIDNDKEVTILDKFVKNTTSEENSSIKEAKFSSSSPILKIKNIENDEEILKDQEYYFRQKLIEEQVLINEGFSNYSSDASRMYISESDQIDNLSVYNTEFFQFQSNLVDPVENSSLNEDLAKDYLTDEASIKLSANENKSSEYFDAQDLNLPSVLIKSNNIRIVARKEFENKKEEKKLDEGSIRLVKNSNKFENYSHIAMEKDGQVGITGKSILLGNFNTELVKQGILKSEDLSETLDPVDAAAVSDLKDMHGKGSTVLIGYDERISEPLVLGNSLEAILKEMININILLTEELKVIADDLAKHIHIGIPTSGVSGPPQPAPHAETYISYSTVIQPDIRGRYEDIQNNLKDMLSRFAKTSWLIIIFINSIKKVILDVWTW